MKPDISSPVIYPLDHAKELIKNKKQENDFNIFILDYTLNYLFVYRYYIYIYATELAL